MATRILMGAAVLALVFGTHGAQAQVQTFSTSAGTLQVQIVATPTTTYQGLFNFSAATFIPPYALTATAGTTNNRCCTYAGTARVEGTIALRLYVDPVAGTPLAAGAGGVEVTRVPAGGTLTGLLGTVALYQGGVQNLSLHARVRIAATELALDALPDSTIQEVRSFTLAPGSSVGLPILAAARCDELNISGSAVASIGLDSLHPGGPVLTVPGPIPVCRGDFNGDGGVNSQDFFDFLGAFFAGAAGADFNGDGVVNSQDFFDFLGAFFGGC